jgi:CIC family chloride channel protein
LHSAVLALRRRLRISETTWLFLLAAIAGALAGLGSIAFHYLIAAVQCVAFGTTMHASGALEAVSAKGFPWWRLLIAPAVGGLVVGPIIYLFAREAKGHGVPAVIRAVHERGGRISPVIALVKTIASAITLGSGGSLGREGPVVQIGASIASGVGQLLGVTPKQLKMLAAAGSAAGLAAIFNAPLGGAFFSLEVIVGSFAMEAFGPVVVASVAATVVSRAILGDNPVITAPPYQLEHAYELGVYVVLGLACGAGAVVFTRGIALGVALFERVKLPEWAKPCLGGLLVGLMALELTPRLLGNGYETVDALMRNQPLEVLLVALFGVKLVATCVTLGSGGSGGVFGPTLFLGAVVGAAVGKAAALLHLPVAPSAAYALVGMAAFVAGATHAPVSMVLMIFEMSDNYRIVLPLLIATSVSAALARRLFAESVDTVLEARQGKKIHKNLEEMTLHAVQVGEAAKLDPQAAVSVSAPLKEVLGRFLIARTEVIAVVSAEGVYQGVIAADWLRYHTEELEPLAKTVVALDLLRADVPVLSPDDPLTKAIDLFHGSGIDALPVLRADGRFLGFLSEGDIVSAYRHAVLKTELVTTVILGGGAQVSPSRVDFGADLANAEVVAPAWLVGKSLGDSRLRTRFGVQVLAIQAKGSPARLPDPVALIREGEILFVVGPTAAISALRLGQEPSLVAAPLAPATPTPV